MFSEWCTMEEALCLLGLSSLLMVVSTQPPPGDPELLPLPPASITVTPSTAQFFHGENVTLSCGVQPSTINWRSRDGRGGQCGDGWGEPVNSSCFINFLVIWDSGVYWCESRDGTSERVNITVTDSSVLLQSPVLPVMEGQNVSLSCRSKNAPSNHRASFYRGSALIGTSPSGHMTLPGVSRSDEDFYSCSISGAQSGSSWISITAPTLAPPTSLAPPTGPALHLAQVWAPLSAVCAVALLVALVLLVRHHRKSPDAERQTEGGEVTYIDLQHRAPPIRRNHECEPSVLYSAVKRQDVSYGEVVFNQQRVRPQQREPGVIYSTMK